MQWIIFWKVSFMEQKMAEKLNTVILMQLTEEEKHAFQNEVIHSSMEKYIAFKLIKNDCPVTLIFMDSLQFLTSSLEKLVQAQDPKEFHLIKTFSSDIYFSLMPRKGVYPNTCMRLYCL